MGEGKGVCFKIGIIGSIASIIGLSIAAGDMFGWDYNTIPDYLEHVKNKSASEREFRRLEALYAETRGKQAALDFEIRKAELDENARKAQEEADRRKHEAKIEAEKRRQEELAKRRYERDNIANSALEDGIEILKGRILGN